MRILVAEDDSVIADFVAQGLREAGFAVDVAATGPDALQKSIHGGYDAAVIDVMLPGLDGLSLIEQLRARKVQTPVLILSARDIRLTIASRACRPVATITSPNHSRLRNCWRGSRRLSAAAVARRNRPAW